MERNKKNTPNVWMCIAHVVLVLEFINEAQKLEPIFKGMTLL